MKGAVQPMIVVTLSFQKYVVLTNALVIQKLPRTALTRAVVTICLYLNVSSNARSLSTLRAASVVMETPQRITPAQKHNRRDM